MIWLLDALSLINSKGVDRKKQEFSIGFVKKSTGGLRKVDRAETCGSRANQKANRLIAIRDLDSGEEMTLKYRGIKSINNQEVFF